MRSISFSLYCESFGYPNKTTKTKAYFVLNENVIITIRSDRTAYKVRRYREMKYSLHRYAFFGRPINFEKMDGFRSPLYGQHLLYSGIEVGYMDH